MSTIIQINSIFQEIFDDPALVVRPETNPSDIADWDSVTQVKLVLAIEEAFATRFTSEDVAGFRCVGDVVAALGRLRGSAV